MTAPYAPCVWCEGRGCSYCGRTGLRCKHCHQPPGLCACAHAKPTKPRASRVKPLPEEPAARAVAIAARLNNTQRSALIWLADPRHEVRYRPHERTQYYLFDLGLLESALQELPIFSDLGIAVLRADADRHGELNGMRTRHLADQAEERRAREKPTGDGTLLSMLGRRS